MRSRIVSKGWSLWTVTAIVLGSFILTTELGFSKSISRGKGFRKRLPAPVTDADYRDRGNPGAAKVRLGNLLFFDKILSGNQNISCATCHHPFAGTGDGLSLSVGEGAKGLGVTRDTGEGDDAVPERVPRNAPPIWNLGASEFSVLFHDGRVEVDPSHPTGFENPAGENLPPGLDSALAVQAMFPVTSGTEMAGQPGENAIAIEAANGNLAGPDGVWAALADRLRAIPEYVSLFQEAYPGEVNSAADITYVHAANAIAAFESVNWRADNSPFDRYLRGERGAMSFYQKKGMYLFYGKAGCYSCHSGKFQTDHQFHAIAMPQLGPGKGDGEDGHEDFGRERVTSNPEDRFKFRTPTLRNVTLSPPYGHDGAYNSLEAILRHHLDPVASLNDYDPSQLVLPPNEELDMKFFSVQDDPALRGAIGAANQLEPVKLSEKEIGLLLEFLGALTDPASIDLRVDVPVSVPSGLPVAD